MRIRHLYPFMPRTSHLSLIVERGTRTPIEDDIQRCSAIGSSVLRKNSRPSSGALG